MSSFTIDLIGPQIWQLIEDGFKARGLEVVRGTGEIRKDRFVDGKWHLNATVSRLPADPKITAAAGRIMDVFMGGHTDWRKRMDESLILESADWQQAVRLARAALSIPVSEFSASWPGGEHPWNIAFDRLDQYLVSQGYEAGREDLRIVGWDAPPKAPALMPDGELADLFSDAMSDVHDMDTGIPDFARACVKALRGRTL